jgi:arylformamidase
MGLFSRLKSYILLLPVVLVLFFPLACNSQEREQPSGQDQAIDDSLSGGTVTSVYDEVLNIVYTQIPGVDSNLTSLDLYIPKSGHDHSIVIYIHGGSWVSGDKSNVEQKPELFTSQGYIFVSVNYRLSPNIQHPVHVQDVAKAVAWVYNNCADYGGDNSNIILIGHSAGAHLAALVATDETRLEAEGLDLTILNGVILLDGLGYDIPRLIETYNLTSLPLYVIPFGADPEGWADASPVIHVNSGKGIPAFMLIYVENSTSTQQAAELLAEQLRQADTNATTVEALAKTHSSLNKDIGLAGDQITGNIMAFIANLHSVN